MAPHAASSRCEGCQCSTRRSPLRGEDVQQPAEHAGGDDQRVHDVDRAAGLRDADRAPEPGRADHELGGDGEDQRDGGGDPHAGGDVGHGGGQADPPDPLEPAEPERARRVGDDRVDVLDAVERLHEQRPERREDGEEDLALQPGAVDEHGERDQRDRRDRAQELDRHAQRAVGEPARADEDPGGHGEQDRQPEAERPALQRVQQRGPEVAGAELAPELRDRLASSAGSSCPTAAPERTASLPERKRAGHGHDRRSPRRCEAPPSVRMPNGHSQYVHYPLMAVIAPLDESVAELVRDGDVVAMEGFTALIPFAAAHEIIRQGRRDLTLVRMTPDLVFDQLIGAGCARRLVFSWGGNPGVGSLHRFRDAVERAWPHALELEEHSPRRDGQPLRGRRLRAAVRGHARLRRHRPARAHADDQADRVPVHRRGADRGRGAAARRRDRARPARRPRRQRAAVGDHRRAEGGGAGGRPLARHGRGGRRRARPAARRDRAAGLDRHPRVGRARGRAAVLRARLLRPRQRRLPRLGRDLRATAGRSRAGSRRCAHDARRPR